MNPTVLAALIGAVGSVIGAFFGVLASAKLTNYKIEVLTRRVEAHNQLIERTYNLEAREDVLEERLHNLEAHNESN